MIIIFINPWKDDHKGTVTLLLNFLNMYLLNSILISKKVYKLNTLINLNRVYENSKAIPYEVN